MATITVCPVDELPPGERRVVEHDGREIGVFNFKGSYYAMRNRCPHQAAPVCVGRLGGSMLPSRPQEYIYDVDAPVVSCPWHHWEFRLEDGTCVEDERARVKTYDVGIDDGYVVVEV